MRSGDHDWTLDADDYDKYLTYTGHSSYTRRSYAFGVRHFTEWALQCHLLPEKLTRSGIANYMLTRRCGVHLHAHVFRHELAQVLLESTGKLQVVQAMLGHAHLSTTANQYTQVTEAQLMEAVKAIDESRGITRARPVHAFAYSDSTIAELEQAIAPALALRRQ